MDFVNPEKTNTQILIVCNKHDLVVKKRLIAQPLPINKHSTMMIYPSPASEVINISLLEKASQFAIINILSKEGKVVHSTKSFGSKIIQIDVSKLLPGIYTFQILQNGSINNRLITISR